MWKYIEERLTLFGENVSVPLVGALLQDYSKLLGYVNSLGFIPDISVMRLHDVTSDNVLGT